MTIITIDQELSMLLHWRREDTSCSFTRWQHFSVRISQSINQSIKPLTLKWPVVNN